MSPLVTVVGGIYGERCAFPRHVGIRGSGGRAAMFARGLGAATRLVSAADPIQVEVYRAICGPFGIETELVEREGEVWFDYAHPLAVPAISPNRPDPVKWPGVCEADVALVFGMLEGRPAVKARRAIFDPQDGSRSKPFEADQSSAEHLAYVLNETEANALTGTTDRASSLQALLALRGVAVVILKLGPEGALVATPKGINLVEAIPTRYVWKIGSGDVFSAAFAVSWGLEGVDPVAAAQFASKATAEYVESMADHFSASVTARVRAHAQDVPRHTWTSEDEKRRSRVYLAAPFFTTGQQWLVDQLKGALERLNLEVFSPIHHVGTGAATEVARADLDGLANADLVFAVLDGNDLGTIFEVGWARATGKPVIALCEDRSQKLTMLTGTEVQVFDDLTSAAYQAAWKALQLPP